MITKKRKFRIVVSVVLIIFVISIYLQLIGIIFPGVFDREFKYKKVDIPEASNLEEVKIAFFGDQGLTEYSKEVLEIIKEEDVDLMVLLGDFDYEDKPQKFKEMYESVYGDEYPLLALVGNHDVLKWDEYKEWMSGIEIDNLNCNGEYGEATVCNYGPVSIALSAVGTLPGNHDEFLGDVLPKMNNSWNICAWHKNHHGYQVGGKETEVGIGTYQLCADNNIDLIMTGHEHSYSRSHGMSDVSNFEVGDDTTPYNMNNNTIVVVSGLGGKVARDTHNDIRDIWGSIYAEEQNAKGGSLICTFREVEANCEFINVDREVIDSFRLEK